MLRHSGGIKQRNKSNNIDLALEMGYNLYKCCLMRCATNDNIRPYYRRVRMCKDEGEMQGKRIMSRRWRCVRRLDIHQGNEKIESNRQ